MPMLYTNLPVKSNVKKLRFEPSVALCARLAPRSKALTNYHVIIAFAVLFFSRNTPESNAEIFPHGSK